MTGDAGPVPRQIQRVLAEEPLPVFADDDATGLDPVTRMLPLGMDRGVSAHGRDRDKHECARSKNAAERCAMDRGVTRRAVHALAGGASVERSDEVVVEEPLEIRVAGDPLAVTLRTPGADADLALGFLFAEGIIESADDVSTVAHCGRPGDEGYGNAIDVTAGPGVALDPERTQGARRGTLTTAACGVCGRRSIDDLLERAGSVDVEVVVPVSLVAHAPELLRNEQANFARTGGIHAACAIDASGTVLAAAEDVGRHNAVDKVVGALLRAKRVGRGARSGAPVLLVVSGRAGFEIVQKAAVARDPGRRRRVRAHVALDRPRRPSGHRTGRLRTSGSAQRVHAQRAHRGVTVLVGIFVGGAARRMGGRAKGLLVAPSGEPIVVALVRAAREAGLAPRLVGESSAYIRVADDVPRIADDPPGIGPLGGLAALLAEARDGRAITVACDMPYVDAQVLRRIADDPRGATVLAARTAPSGPWEPMLARYDAARAREPLARAIAEGVRSFQALFGRIDIEVDELPLDACIGRALADWDTPEDIARGGGQSS